jgi:hypothetical protein
VRPDVVLWKPCLLGRRPVSWHDLTCGTVDPARRGVPMGATTGASSESKKSRLLVGLGKVAKGKTASSKTTCQEITRRLVERSRQR